MSRARLALDLQQRVSELGLLPSGPDPLNPSPLVEDPPDSNKKFFLCATKGLRN